MKIFLTGAPGSGKSTVLMKVIERLRAEGLRIGGIATPEIRVRGYRTGFSVIDLSLEKEGILASVDQPEGPRVGKYRVNLEDFERVALPALTYAQEECDVICVDELGTMEFFSKAFKQKIDEILRSEKPLIAVVHRNYARNYEKYGRLHEVTPTNREKLPEIIASVIKYRTLT